MQHTMVGQEWSLALYGQGIFLQVSARKRTFVDLHTDDRCGTGRDTVAR
ncbi:hypothetical protein [Shewanella sp.]